MYHTVIQFDFKFISVIMEFQNITGDVHYKFNQFTYFRKYKIGNVL